MTNPVTLNRDILITIYSQQQKKNWTVEIEVINQLILIDF